MAVSVVSLAIPSDNESGNGNVLHGQGQGPSSRNETEVAGRFSRVSLPSTTMPSTSPSTSSASISGCGSGSGSDSEIESVPSQDDHDSDSLRKLQWQKLMVCTTTILVMTAVVFALGVVLVKVTHSGLRFGNMTRKSGGNRTHATGAGAGTGINTENVTFLRDSLALPYHSRGLKESDIAGASEIPLADNSSKCYRNLEINQSDKTVSENVTVQIIVLNTTEESLLDPIDQSITYNGVDFNNSLLPSSNSSSNSRKKEGKESNVAIKNNVTLSTQCGSSLEAITRLSHWKGSGLRFKWWIGSTVYPAILSINDVTENPEENIYWTIYIFEDKLLVNHFSVESVKYKSYFLSKDMGHVKVETKRVACLFWLQKIQVHQSQDVGGKKEVESEPASAVPTSNLTRRNNVVQVLLFLKAYFL